MAGLSVPKLGGYCLIIGPVVGLFAFVFQPGGVLINNALMNNAEATFTALAHHQSVANITGIGIALGLTLVLYGQFALLCSLRSGHGEEALSQLGLVFLAVGAVGWVLMQGLNLEMSDTRLEDAASFQSAAAVFRVEFGMSLISGLAVALGFLLFSIGLALRSEFNRVAAVVIAMVSIVALVSQVIGISDASRFSTAILITRLCFVVWAIWSISLGTGMLRRHALLRIQDDSH
jgi:hypothetical protein